MVSGRLNRESNPVPGEKPGFLPQHESETSGEFVVTGERNPYPVKIKNTDEQAIPVQLTGRNIEEKLEVSNFTVTTGNTTTLGDFYVNGADCFVLSLITNAPSNFEVQYRFKTMNGVRLDNNPVRQEVSGYVRYLSSRIPVLSGRVEVSLKNNSTTDRTFSLYIIRHY